MVAMVLPRRSIKRGLSGDIVLEDTATRLPQKHHHAMVPPRPARPRASTALAMALLFLLVADRPPSSVATAALTGLEENSPSLLGKVDPTSGALPPSPLSHHEAVVVLGSGRSLGVSALRRILTMLHSGGPVTVRLASGKERAFADAHEYAAAARADELRGAKLVVPAEFYPCDLVADIVETEFAQRTQLVLPDGRRLPYNLNEGDSLQDLSRSYPARISSSYPGSNPYQHQPLYHRQPAVYDWLTPFEEDVPEEQLHVAIGGSQRLSIKVHDAILESYATKKPLDVDLMSGERVTAETYEALLSKMVEPRYFGARILLGNNVRIPFETYRAVVDAHKHRGVYVVDPDDHRMQYADYVRRKKGKALKGGKDTTDRHSNK